LYQAINQYLENRQKWPFAEKRNRIGTSDDDGRLQDSSQDPTYVNINEDVNYDSSNQYSIPGRSDKQGPYSEPIYENVTNQRNIHENEAYSDDFDSEFDSDASKAVVNEADYENLPNYR